MNGRSCYINNEEFLLHLYLTFDIRNSKEFRLCLSKYIEYGVYVYNNIISCRSGNNIPLAVKIFFELVEVYLKGINGDNYKNASLIYAKNISLLIDSVDNVSNTDSFLSIMNKIKFDNSDFLAEIRHAIIHKNYYYDEFIITKCYEIFFQNLIAHYFKPMFDNLHKAVTLDNFTKILSYYDNHKFNKEDIISKLNLNTTTKNTDDNDFEDINNKLKYLKNNKDSVKHFMLYIEKLKFKGKYKKIILHIISKIKLKKIFTKDYSYYLNIIQQILIEKFNLKNFNDLAKDSKFKYFIDFLAINSNVLLCTNNFITLISEKYNYSLKFDILKYTPGSIINYNDISKVIKNKKIFKIKL